MGRQGKTYPAVFMYLFVMVPVFAGVVYHWR